MTIEEMRQKKLERGYTYEQIASISGVPLGTVQKILGGMTQAPRYNTVRALESFFAMSDAAILDICQKTPVWRSKEATGHTAGEYASLPDDQRAEMIDGEPCDAQVTSLTRQRIIAELFSQFKNYTDMRDISGMVPLMAPVDMRPDGDNRTVLRPDVMILRDPSKIKRWGVLGAPDFVADVFAPPASRRTYLKKLAKYAETGVQEYWMIDTEVRKLIVYPLEGDECLKVYKLDGRVACSVFEDLFIDLKRIADLLRDYPEE